MIIAVLLCMRICNIRSSSLEGAMKLKFVPFYYS